MSTESEGGQAAPQEGSGEPGKGSGGATPGEQIGCPLRRIAEGDGNVYWITTNAVGPFGLRVLVAGRRMSSGTSMVFQSDPCKQCRLPDVIARVKKGVLVEGSEFMGTCIEGGEENLHLFVMRPVADVPDNCQLTNTHSGQFTKLEPKKFE